MQVLKQVLFYLAGSIPFLLGVLLVAGANCKKDNRYRQLFLPVVAIVYGIVLLVNFNNLHEMVSNIVMLIKQNIPFLANLNVAVAEASLFNLLFMIAFAVVKLAYKGIVAALAMPFETVLKGLFGAFYEHDDELDRWHLRETLVGVRRMLRNLFVVSVVLAVVLFVCGNVFTDLPAFRNPFYPAFGVAVLGELFYFLDGITREEYENKIQVEGDSAQRVFQYAKIQKSLTHFFSDRLLHAFSQGQRRSSSESHHDFCENLIGSGGNAERVAGAYFMALVDKGILGRDSVGSFDELDHDRVLDTVKLLEGKSVMFASPFYTDFMPYVFLPLNAQLMRGGKVIVLHGMEGSETLAEGGHDDGLAAFVEQGLALVTNVDGMWDVGPLSQDGSEMPDVALVPFSALGDTRQLLANAAFFEQVSFALVIDPSNLLATYQVGLSILAEYLSAGPTVTYCIFDKNSDGLVDSLSHALRTNLTEVGATSYCEGVSVGMMWDVDGEFLQHRLFPDVAHYLGVGTELGLVALRGQVEKVSWAARESIPLADQRWIMGQYYGEMLRFAELPQEQNQIEEHFEFYPDLWSMEKRQRRFIVVDDEFANLFEAYRQFATRGSEQAFVNVLSPNYLLRSYMVDNADMLVKDPKAIPALAPDFSKSQRNVVFSIIMMMVQGRRRMSEDEIRARFKYAGVLDGRSIYDVLAGMMVEHFDAEGDDLPESHIVETEVNEYVPALRDIVSKRYYGLDDAASFSFAFRSLRNVPLVTEAPDGGELLLGSRLYGHVYQLFLPGQFVVLQGKYYEVLSINDEAGVMLRRAADHFTRRRYYRQLRSYTVGDWCDGGRPGDSRKIGNVRVMQGNATVEVKTTGYLDLSDYGNMATARRIELSDIPVRSYRNKGVVRIDLADAPARVVATLAVLISESFKTLYPRDWPYLAVLVDPGIDDTSVPLAVKPLANSSYAGFANEFADALEAVPEGVLYQAKCPVKGQAIYIVEDSLIDIGLVSSVERNLSRILELCWDFLDWHAGKLAGIVEEEPKIDPGEFPGDPEPPAKKGFFGRLIDKIRNLFGGGKKKGGAPAAGEGGQGKQPEAPVAADPAPEPAPVPEPKGEPAPAPAPSGPEPAFEPATAPADDAPTPAAPEPVVVEEPEFAFGIGDGDNPKAGVSSTVVAPAFAPGEPGPGQGPADDSPSEGGESDAR